MAYNAFRTEEQMFAELARLPLRPFREVVREGGGNVEWSESFGAAEKIEVSATPSLVLGDLGWRLQVSDYLSDWIIVSDEDAARGLLAA